MQYQHLASSPSWTHAAIVMFVICGVHFVNGLTMDEQLEVASPVLMHVDGGPNDIHELDIKVDLDLDQPQWKRIKRAGMIAPTYRWPDNKVPYTIAGFDAAKIATIKEGMAEWSSVTCLTFVPRTTEQNYLKIISSTGCWSFVGRIASKITGQDLSLGTGCVTKSIVVHELGHAIGLHHEHTRPDRDQFVTINMANIIPGKESNFNKRDATEVSNYGTPYDYRSVMHYGKTFFSTDTATKNTIVPKDASFLDIIGTATTRTFLDAKMINIMYSCNAACSNKELCTAANKYQGSDCKCHCQGGTATDIVTCSGDPPKPTNILLRILCFFLKIFNLCRIGLIATMCASTCG